MLHVSEFANLNIVGIITLGMWRKVLQFFPASLYLHTIMVFQLYKTATSVSTKASRSSREFSLKLPLAYSEMDESTLLTHVFADFTLSRMTMQSQEDREEPGAVLEISLSSFQTASLLLRTFSGCVWRNLCTEFPVTLQHKFLSDGLQFSFVATKKKDTVTTFT